MRKVSIALTAHALLVTTAVTAAATPEHGLLEQAEDGRVLYARHCATCHGADLGGSGHGPALNGQTFQDAWGSSSTNELLAYNTSTMPPGAAATLSTEAHTAITAFVLVNNGVASGPALGSGAGLVIGTGTPVPADNAAMDSWSDAGTIDAIARSRSGFTNKSVRDYRAVSQSMLNDPPPADWLSWRRTLDGQGHSPLDAVNRTNVGELQLAWAIAMRDGSNQVTPLVHDGIMYLAHPGNVLQALDAASGELIWEYAYTHPPESRTLGGPIRNIAIYEDKLFLATYDAAIVAVDARTGKQVWRTEKVDFRDGYTHTAGPIVGAGVVLSGINGCERYSGKGCFITGHDPDTGEELWRTSTIALPGDAGDDTWGGQPAEYRAGGDTWIAGSFDPTLNLFYIGTSQAKPWVAASRGMTTSDAALYTNSTLAIEPRTGRIAWHFQHVPGETIDMEVGFERVLIDVQKKPYVYTVGKDGILWKLDRQSGAFVDYVETLPQNVFEAIDKDTGRVTYRADIRDATVGDTIHACPGIYGGHNWQAMAYSPEANSLVIPLHRLCADMVGRTVERAPGAGGYGGDSRTFEMPGSDGKLGRLAAFDVRSMQMRWVHEQRAMFMTGALTTAGGLVFIGDLDRYFKAFDAKTGDLLWQTRLAAPAHGYPISYEANGVQYIAVPTGMGVFRAMTAMTSPDIHQPANGQALYVFRLPQNQRRVPR